MHTKDVVNARQALMITKKRSNLISFKLPEDLLDKLEAIQKDKESLSLVAKRIVEESIEGAKPKTTVEDRIEGIEDKIDNILALLQAHFIIKKTGN